MGISVFFRSINTPILPTAHTAYTQQRFQQKENEGSGQSPHLPPMFCPSPRSVPPFLRHTEMPGPKSKAPFFLPGPRFPPESAQVLHRSLQPGQTAPPRLRPAKPTKPTPSSVPEFSACSSSFPPVSSSGTPLYTRNSVECPQSCPRTAEKKRSGFYGLFTFAGSHRSRSCCPHPLTADCENRPTRCGRPQSCR